MGESKLTRPNLDIGNKLIGIDRHMRIVKTLQLKTEAQTRSLAETLAKSKVIETAFIELHGDLGVGKTTWVRHLLVSLGINDRVKSPTYSIVEFYEIKARQLKIWHFDFYRFDDPQEWEDAGFRDIFSSPGLKLVEWPSHGPALAVTADLLLDFKLQADETRTLTLTGQTDRGTLLLDGVVP